MTLAVVVIVMLTNWHEQMTNKSASSSQHQSHRLLQQPKPIDDDITRDDVCRDYLMNFLNGTTDAKDECQAMSKAWEIADCVDYNHNVLRADQNATNTTDDLLIDDAFEKWECCSTISDFYGKHCKEEHLNASKLLGIVLVMVVCGWMKSLLRIANIRWIPDAGACIAVGAIVGGILRLIHSNVVEDQILAFDNDLFLQIMVSVDAAVIALTSCVFSPSLYARQLPPIVFQAAISIDKQAFRRDFFPILTFAIVGTGLSAVAIGYITHHLSSMGGNGLPLLDSLLFGALMSSIDPVATLGILSSVGVSQGDTLYTLIFGESLLNDGVSIVLFDSLVRHMGDDSVVDQATVRDTLFHFTVVTIGSIIIGVVCGAFCTLYFWFLQGKQSAVSEVALFFAWALVPYYIADGLGYSGIISIMVMGFMLDYYIIGGHQSEDGEWMEYMELRYDSEGSHHHPIEPVFDRIKSTCCRAFSGRGLILSRSRHHVGFVAEVISSIMETAIFAYLGLFLFNDRVWDFKLSISGLFACISSRAGMVVALSLLVNACVWMDVEAVLSRLWRRLSGRRQVGQDDDSVYSDSRVYLDAKTQLILFSAGVRGAVSYALVQNIPVYDSVTKHGSHFKGELRSMTSATIVVILFAFGAMTYFSVQRDLNPDRERVMGSLTHRLLTNELASDDGNDATSDVNSSLEMDGHQSFAQRSNSLEVEGAMPPSSRPAHDHRLSQEGRLTPQG